MPLKQRDTETRTPATNYCPACANIDNQAARHRHLLAFDGDLGKHLRDSGTPEESIPGILAWVHTMRDRYAGRVTEDGIPLSAADLRHFLHRQYQQTYHDIPGPLGHEPRTPAGRAITMDVFRHLLTHTKSEYANLWGHLMAEQFSPVATSEAQWSDFVRFAAEFREAGAREECVEQIDTRPMLRVVNNKE